MNKVANRISKQSGEVRRRIEERGHQGQMRDYLILATGRNINSSLKGNQEQTSLPSVTAC